MTKYFSILSIIFIIIISCFLMVDAFEAELETPITQPTVTDTVAGEITFRIDFQGEGSVLERTTVIINCNHWNNPDDTAGRPNATVVAETEPIEYNGVVFFQGIGATASSLSSRVRLAMIDAGLITEDDTWL